MKKLQHLINYSIVALFFFGAGLVLSPQGVVMQRIRRAVSYTRWSAQRLYAAWNTDKLFLAEQHISLAEFEHTNQTYILYFWATWCPHCTNVAPLIEKLQTASYQTVAMPFDTDKAAYADVMQETTPFYPNIMLADESQTLQFVPRQDEFNIPSIPSVWIVNNGKVKKIFIGETGIAKLLLYLEKKYILTQ